jgi:hypothetical protein
MLTIVITTALFVGVGFLINLITQAPKELQVPPKLGKTIYETVEESHAKFGVS